MNPVFGFDLTYFHFHLSGNVRLHVEHLYPVEQSATGDVGSGAENCTGGVDSEVS